MIYHTLHACGTVFSFWKPIERKYYRNIRTYNCLLAFLFMNRKFETNLEKSPYWHTAMSSEHILKHTKLNPPPIHLVNDLLNSFFFSLSVVLSHAHGGWEWRPKTEETAEHWTSHNSKMINLMILFRPAVRMIGSMTLESIIFAHFQFLCYCFD